MDELMFRVDEAGYLHITLHGPTWYATNATLEDATFLISLFMDESVMKWYGKGASPDAADVLARTLDLWLPRFQQGEPHGGLIVRLRSNDNPVGFVLVGSSGVAGTGSIAYAFERSVWNTGLASSVVAAMVKTWAPQVVQAGFRVYNGRTLERIDANVHVDNKASRALLTRVGFSVIDDTTTTWKLRLHVG